MASDNIKRRRLILFKVKSGLILIAGILLLIPPSAAADDLVSNTDERSAVMIKEENRIIKLEQAQTSQAQIAAQEEAPSQEDIFIRYGGWASSYFRHYTNIDNQDSLEDFIKWSWNQDLYLWFYFNYQSTHTVYVQMHNSYVDRGVGATYTGIGADYEGPALSMAFSQINLAPRYGTPLKTTVGRQYLFLGRGVVYSAVHDGVAAEVFLSDFYLKGFAAKTQPRQDNIDFSNPGFDKEGDRFFVGGEVAYLGIKNASLYAFALSQKDFSSENTDNPAQSFHYDSQYFGGGLTYKFSDALDVWVESTAEYGEGFTDAFRTRLRESKIDAWAFLSGAKYRFDLPTHPILEASFAYGSGDEDRTRVTNTLGGDVDGKDKNFHYFGYYLTGYALQPRLSNIKIFHTGASFQPLETSTYFKKLALGVKYFKYWKDEAGGGSSDFESTVHDINLGKEVNIFTHWKINESLLFSCQFGVFYPGDAFPETTRDHTKYFLSGITLTF